MMQDLSSQSASPKGSTKAVAQLAILGSTGSIGESTLKVVASNAQQFAVFALSAHSNISRLAEQCQQFKPKVVVISDASLKEPLAKLIAGLNIDILAGPQALDSLAKAPEVDMVMCAIVGAAGLSSSLAAAKAGKRVLLANKESLVMSGELFMREVAENGAELLPIDSEHNAIFQSLPNDRACDLVQGRCNLTELGISKILLTGSGGPFRTAPLASLKDKSPIDACNHPNWSMGQKISVDSATMMNKGLELIEAHYLFRADNSQIDIVVHPQSVVHSMVQYLDGSVIAQLGQPDMCTPIAYGLSFPERIQAGVPALDFTRIADLSFEAPDFERFPALRLATQALEDSGSAPTILNAANEVAVAAFLAEQIKFTAITDIIANTLDAIAISATDTLEQILEADRQARAHAQSLIN